MNYIQEINAFYDWLETHSVSDSCIVLWFALMHIDNKAGWIPEFAVAISTLETKTGLKKDSIIRARNRLQQEGRIEFRSRSGQQSAVYNIISFCGAKTDTKCDTNRNTNRAQSATQSATQTASINKLNEIKLNNEEEGKPSVSPAGDNSSEADKKIKPSFILDEYNRICKNLRPASKITERRSQAIGARLREYGIDNVMKMLEYASQSNFLAGQNQKHFMADIDWIFLPNNFIKVLENKYANNKTTSLNGSPIDRKRDPKFATEHGYGQL